jgi:hypothetical protein
MRSPDQRPSASHLLTHIYLKKQKLSSVLATLNSSVIVEGIVELQRRVQSFKHQNQEEIDINKMVQSKTFNNNKLTSDFNNQSWDFNDVK